MNTNFLKYSSKFMGVVLAAAAFASCKKNEFTERDAFDLERDRLRAQRSIDSLRLLQEKADRDSLREWQRRVDELNRRNAGGQVFYTVSIVNAGRSVSTSGGREETPVTGAVVTASQFGKTFTATGSNGIYTFPDLRSGEVVVSISSSATPTTFTPVSYVANLTPDNSVPNNSTVYVGNVIPVFEKVDATRMATIQGRMYAETSLINDTEEALTNAQIAGTAITATIDVGARGGVNYFHERYIRSSQDEGQNTQGNPTNSGAIRRISYGEAQSSSGITGANGEYSMLVPASAVGLPIQLNVSEFATTRTYYRVNAEGATVLSTSERFLYGPNVQPTPVELGAGSPTLNFQAFTTAATVSATFTAAGPTQVIGAPTLAGGFYLTAPTVTFSAPAAGGTTATGTISLGGAYTPSPGANAIRPLGTFSTFNGGTGYTADATATLVRTDTAYIGYGTQQGAAQAAGILNYVHITNGGFGFVPTTAVTVRGSGFTNFLPRVNFTLDQAGNPYVPAVGSPATGTVLLDAIASYTADGRGVIGNGVPPGIGSVAQVVVGSTGNYAGLPLPFVNFTYGIAQTITGFDAIAGNLFVASGDGGINFRDAWTAPVGHPLEGATVTATAISFPSDPANIAANTAQGAGGEYTFVPLVAAQPNADYTAAGGTTVAATLVATVDSDSDVDNDPTTNDPSPSFGKIVRIDLVNPGSYVGSAGKAGQTDFLVGGVAPFPAGTPRIDLQISPNNIGNTLAAARTMGAGTGLSNYVVETTNAVGPNINAANALLARVGGVMSNSSTANLTEAQYINGNTFLVAFQAPATAATGGTYAYGVPVIRDNKLVGVRVLNPGNGYNVGTTGRANMFLVPNPWYNVGVGASPVYGTNPALSFPANNNIFGALAGNMGTVGTAARGTSAARIDFTVINPGAGYSAAPRVFAWQTNNLSGTLVQSPVALLTATGGIASVPSITVANGGANFANWTAGASAATRVVDPISESLNTLFNIPANRTFTITGGGIQAIRLNQTAAATGPQVSNLLAPPTVTVTSTDATAAGAAYIAVIDQNPTSPTFARVISLTRQNAGTGYSSGNQWQRFTTGNPTGGNSQGFMIFGGNSAMNAGRGQTAMNFDVYSGLTYVRDIHFGTGQLLD